MAPPANVHTFTDSPGAHIPQGFRAVNIGVNVVLDVHTFTGDVHRNSPAFPRVGERVNIAVNIGKTVELAQTLENAGQTPPSVNV